MSKADVDLCRCLPYNNFINKLSDRNAKKLEKLWGNINYTKYFSVIENRIMMIRRLHEFYPFLELQSESIYGWRTKLYNFNETLYFSELYAPAVHYRILPNEIVFELDCDEGRKKAKEEAMRIVKHLIILGAKPLVGFSGNRGYHIHLIIAPPSGDIINFSTANGCREFTKTLYEILVEITEPKYLDEGVMKHKNHTIRSFYSVNLKSMKWKKPVFGRDYEVWVLTRQFGNRVLEEMEKSRFVEEVSKIVLEEVRTNRTPIRKSWVSKILKEPEKVKDGRERLLWLAIVPFLYAENLDVLNTCKIWVEKTGGRWSKYVNVVKSTLRHCEEYERATGKKWHPISLKKLIEMYPDLEYLDNF